MVSSDIPHPRNSSNMEKKRGKEKKGEREDVRRTEKQTDMPSKMDY
jgi:hypothetical protein